MSGFSNPVVNAAGTLIRTLMKSANYVAGITGWQISKSGSAEFNDGTFRGIVRAIAANGSEIDIDPAALYPQIIFYSRNHLNNAFINATSLGASDADLGLNSGNYTPADGTQRRGRLYLLDSSDLTDLAIIKASNQAVKGGWVRVTSTEGFWGYRDTDASVDNYMKMGISDWKITSPNANGTRDLPYHLFSYNAGNAAIPSIPNTNVETALLGVNTGTTFKAGRVYKARVRMRWGGNLAGQMGETIRIRKGLTTVGALWASCFLILPSNAFFVDPPNAVVEMYFGNYTGADITSSFVLTGQSTNGATVTLGVPADNSGRWHFDIDDVGSTTDWPNESPMT